MNATDSKMSSSLWNTLWAKSFFAVCRLATANYIFVYKWDILTKKTLTSPNRAS